MEKYSSVNNEALYDASLLRALDKGIDDMENGRTVPHDKAMDIVRQRLKEHVRNSGNS
ncbi:MAG: hypothetical protein IJD31_10285 [Lachnospiraceae bacterium]|nr:hypothetical protein [Lachnospiraceae bacterium]